MKCVQRGYKHPQGAMRPKSFTRPFYPLQAMTNSSELHAYDPRTDRTFHKLLKSPSTSEVANSSHNSNAFTSDFAVFKSNNVDFDYDPANSNSNLGVCISKFSLYNMADNDMTLKELATFDIMCQP
ncbi:hypothetical protein CR513_02687, partial [Mucuna pruriens]